MLAATRWASSSRAMSVSFATANSMSPCGNRGVQHAVKGDLGLSESQAAPKEAADRAFESNPTEH